MSNQAEFKIVITDINPATGRTEEIGEIDLFAFSETEVYAMYSGKGLSKDKAAAYIKQIKKLLRKPTIAPNSNIELFGNQSDVSSPDQNLPSPRMRRVRDAQQEQKEQDLIEKHRKKCGRNTCKPQE